MQPLQSHPETWSWRPQDPKEWPGLLLWDDREEAHNWHPEAVVTRREEQTVARVHQSAKEAKR